MTQRTTYRITTVHPNGYRDGDHEVTVTTAHHRQTNRLQKCVSGGGFGCSRDCETPSDLVAINNLLAENGMRLVKITALITMHPRRTDQ